MLAFKTMDLQPILQNELVRLRPLEQTDLEALYQVAKDPKIWEQHHVKRYLRDVFENFFAESIASKGAFIIYDKQSGDIIGSSRYMKVDGFPKMIEIGWTFIDREFWGGTYNASIKKMMIEHAFKYFDAIIFKVNKKNKRSQKAVGKIGGRKIDDSEFNGLSKRYVDTHVFIIEK
ncbi:GNAT family N-acetyltransferase [Psychroserpens sp. XS_ASV72]|uniref:GNAT family N-acetyltransferase n=1 Tax=Psychroserpens sp. XS_ASV72 TaxID=3241293 RepID=UPI003514E93C